MPFFHCPNGNELAVVGCKVAITLFTDMSVCALILPWRVVIWVVFWGAKQNALVEYREGF